jgi:hypothetical protein
MLRLKAGRSIADDHYSRSQWVDYRQGGDSQVMRLIALYEGASDRVSGLNEECAEVYRQVADVGVPLDPTTTASVAVLKLIHHLTGQPAVVESPFPGRDRSQCQASREYHGLDRQCRLPSGHDGEHRSVSSAGPVWWSHG